MDEAGAVHRLDRSHDRLAELGRLADQATQPVSIRRRRGDPDRLTCLVHQMHIHSVAGQVQPSYNMATGPPRGRFPGDNSEGCHRGGPLFMTFSCATLISDRGS